MYGVEYIIISDQKKGKKIDDDSHVVHQVTFSAPAVRITPRSIVKDRE